MVGVAGNPPKRSSSLSCIKVNITVTSQHWSFWPSYSTRSGGEGHRRRRRLSYFAWPPSACLLQRASLAAALAPPPAPAAPLFSSPPCGPVRTGVPLLPAAPPTPSEAKSSSAPHHSC
ncbi:hypothetical protein FQA47_002171 [Oryzias melastigma]|uniref:Uncharacterized protein n=1 Tax=Oryzias melastigma TaxID=30732 RepID=A0A834C280_ORYME|nr:hypothetical protein FQA47_002171 [Oryzias melastigma]